MSVESIKRKNLPNAKDFKQFWRENGPFRYALTSRDYPPVLLETEEWIFSNDIQILLKTLMQFDKRRMKIVKAPFNPENKTILRPEKLSPWKIIHFPQEWDTCFCDVFVPRGHLTRMVLEKIAAPDEAIEPGQVEVSFFQCLEMKIEQLGYLLLKPRGSSKYASTTRYLAEWEEDDRDAGLL